MEMTVPGRPRAADDDIEARRRAFQRLRARLGMNRNELAALTGLTPRTVGNYFAPSSPRVAATWVTIDVMRSQAIVQAKAAVSIAEDNLFRAEVELQSLERESEAV